MSIVNLSFEEMLKRCRNHSIVRLKDKKVRVTGALFAETRKSYFDGKILVTIKQRDSGGWSESSVHCHFTSIDSFRKLEVGMTVSVIGILNFAGDCVATNGVYINMIDCQLDIA